MAYPDFTLETAEASLGLRARPGDLFSGLLPVAVPGWLQDLLARGMQLALVSEKARSEFIVVPILLASRELSGNLLAIYSGQRLDVIPVEGCWGSVTSSWPSPSLRAGAAAARPVNHDGRGEEE